MTVYVDLLFGLNTVINYLLLRGSAVIGGCPASLGRLAAAASIGGLYAVAGVLPGLQGLQSLPFQAVCAGIMLIAAFGWKRNTVKQGLFFFALSSAFSGLVLLVIQLLEPQCCILGGQIYYAMSVPALLLLAGLGYGVAAAVLAGSGTHTGGDLLPMQVSLGNRSVSIRALRDTGNTMRDPLTGQAVLVASGIILQKLLPEHGISEEELRTPAALLDRLSVEKPALRCRLLTFRSVGTQSGLLLAIRCQMEYDGKRRNILTAFAPMNVTEDGRFDALWGGELL